MTEERKHAILFAATLLCARKPSCFSSKMYSGSLNALAIRNRMGWIRGSTADSSIRGRMSRANEY
jgi:hypothetical protein